MKLNMYMCVAHLFNYPTPYEATKNIVFITTELSFVCSNYAANVAVVAVFVADS